MAPADANAAARHRLTDRLGALAASLAARDEALGLLCLGSLAHRLDQVDEHSDLDFFVLVRDGAKHRYIEDLAWLAAAHPLVWHFRNTADGCKALMRDGVFCEFAVFEVRELAAIPYSPGRFIWRREELAPELTTPRRALPERSSDAHWLANEALSNLLVGMHRYARGERLAAMRLVQVHALDRLLELRELRGEVEPSVGRDAFAVERRVELRQPGLADAWKTLAPGVDATPQAAGAILAELQRLHHVPSELADEIRTLLAAGI